ncbi:chalcone isomerase family protein [Sideroxydans lithotrophicus]|uniref:Putative lipoprotein transmembrane n=1 Tax=Sideroxydans lithotrophicus (strain ES-1) TaxID=580332 RepID=D5CSZ2_SIDLE|nr:chalcone isomerase family protein [Sideroxydans lithotrophicus]ADE12078.1 putative lipoprotein transmembrane [Sideroxydans lithotrophicus ES-1]
MKRILLMLTGLLLCGSVGAMEVAGVNLPDSVQVDAHTLVLNGAGIRSKWFFKVYVGALYLPQRQSSAEAIIAYEHEHRMVLHMLRGLSSKRLYGAFSEAMELNRTPAEMAAMDAQLKQMKQIFDAVDEVKEGDVITLDYLPDSGTRIGVNGTARGTIAGMEFNRALLEIWLGRKPVQEDMKKGLLGG